MKKKYLNNFKNLKEIEMGAGVIPLGFLNKTSVPGALIVGDAAAQVKATSGGGIYMAMRCAEHCGRAIIKSLEEEDMRAMREYDKLWKRDVGGELKRDLFIHSIYKELNNDEIGKIMDMLSGNIQKSVIGAFGDIDFPSVLVIPLFLTTPKLHITLFPRVVNYFSQS
ncbi:MAG: hypothetical protein DRN20_04215 [Thermoplasmata archaeon]|nr:MAG: hypothetical protein DRN20_04215 [Thermoplasmata archaeon]